MVVVYSVSGSIGLDRIHLQSYDNFGHLVDKEVLTGNITTQLVLKSAYDVNVTVLPEDSYYYAQRRFLLYFYIVPKCYLILCPNITVYPHTTSTIKSTQSTTATTTTCAIITEPLITIKTTTRPVTTCITTTVNTATTTTTIRHHSISST